MRNKTLGLPLLRETKSSQGAEAKHCLFFYLKNCRKMSWRGRDHWLTLELAPGSHRLLTPHPLSHIICCAHHSHSENCLEGFSLVEQCGVETLWTVHMTEPC